jgi:hypothetical protein
VLHLSDLHMTAGQRSKQEWVASLAELQPDLVVDTGDNLAGMDAVPGTLRALEPLLDLPGAFVMASNDYYAPRPKNPLKYFKRDHKRVHGDELPWRDLRDAMAARGWLTSPTPAVSSPWPDGGSPSPASTTRTSAGPLRPRRGPADPTADLRIGLATPPSRGCSTASPATATTCCCAGTPTAGSCGCPSTARW